MELDEKGSQAITLELITTQPATHLLTFIFFSYIFWARNKEKTGHIL